MTQLHLSLASQPCFLLGSGRSGSHHPFEIPTPEKVSLLAEIFISSFHLIGEIFFLSPPCLVALIQL